MSPAPGMNQVQQAGRIETTGPAHDELGPDFHKIAVPPTRRRRGVAWGSAGRGWASAAERRVRQWAHLAQLGSFLIYSPRCTGNGITPRPRGRGSPQAAAKD